MLDLFSGNFGWSTVFAARGWDCFALDWTTPQMEIPRRIEFYAFNVLDIDANWIKWLGVDFICASSPCEEFSTMRNFRPPVAYPEMGIKLFNHTRALCEQSGVPYVMENVAGAGKYVGKAVNHCGSYYLWGSGVPPILPQGINKGMTELAMGLREHKGKSDWNLRHGKKGQTPTARVATIPPELANCVADYAERILELAETTL